MFRKETFRLAELFCGPGGIALGAKRARVRKNNCLYSVEPVWANDIDFYTCKTYASNIHRGYDAKRLEEAVVCAPIQDVNLGDTPFFNALAFGFPCNDFSLVGEQKGFDGKYGPLYSFGKRALDAHDPKWFLAENAGGLQSAHEGRALQQILGELENSGKYGYQLTPHLYKFEQYGVPQSRHRVVIVGIRKDLDLTFSVPAPTTAGRPITAKEALENTPILPTAKNNERRELAPQVAARMKYIPPGKNAWHDGIPAKHRLHVKGAWLSQIYRRLDPSKPAYTVTGSGGGGTHIYHWSEIRALTNRERARLQTFPDDFVFEGGLGSVRRQIGMAVPPEAARIIIESILKTFAGIHYKSVPAMLSRRQNELTRIRDGGRP